MASNYKGGDNTYIIVTYFVVGLFFLIFIAVYSFKSWREEILGLFSLLIGIIALIYSIIGYQEARQAKLEAFNASTEAKSAKDEVKQKIHSINRVRKIESFIENYQSPKDYDEFDNAVIQANILINELDREVFKTTMVDIDGSNVPIIDGIAINLEKIVTSMVGETKEVFNYNKYRSDWHTITGFIIRLKSSLDSKSI